MSSNYTIYKGHVWKEYGSGKFILTLNGSKAGALQSIIPLFIALVGPLSWTLIKYPWFRLSVKRTTRKYPYYPFYYCQKQTLLRNSAGDLGTVGSSVGIFNSWRKHGFWEAFRRTAPLTIVALLFFCAWQVAGIVSFYIWQTKPPTVGLIRSSACGYNFLVGPAAELPFRRTGLSQTIQAETYVTQCYGQGSSGACNVYANQSLAYTGANASCPFETDDICITENSAPFQLQSGQINSHSDLGINAPPKNRVTYQKNVTCSPIHSTKFAQIVLANETNEAYYWPPNTKLQQFYYGELNGANASYTFEYSDWAPLDNFGYDITGVLSNPGAPGTFHAWNPNSTFTSRTDADISILFLTPNTISYSFPVDDPWFLTGDSYHPPPVDGETLTLYVPAVYVNTMGCVEQHRFCNPTNNRCTPYVAYLQIPDLLTTIDYNPTQLATAERITTNLEMMNTFNSVNGRRSAALLASQTVADLLQTKALPVDQWRVEVSNWFAVSLAKLQEGIVEFAGGPTDPELVQYVKFPVDTDTASLCYNQLVQLPPGYTNFDFGALMAVTVLGFAIVVLGLSFESIAEWWHKRRVGRVTGWLEDGQFHLLKRMYEKQGVGGWEQLDDDFPITISNPLSGTPQPNGVSAASPAGSSNATVNPNSGIPLQTLQNQGTSTAAPANANATGTSGSSAPAAGSTPSTS